MRARLDVGILVSGLGAALIGVYAHSFAVTVGVLLVAVGLRV